MESQSGGRLTFDDKEKRRMHYELGNLMDKHKEMAKRIGLVSFVDHLLSIIDFPYSTKIIMLLLLPKFKVP